MTSGFELFSRDAVSMILDRGIGPGPTFPDRIQDLPCRRPRDRRGAGSRYTGGECAARHGLRHRIPLTHGAYSRLRAKGTL